MSDVKMTAKDHALLSLIEAVQDGCVLVGARAAVLEQIAIEDDPQNAPVTREEYDELFRCLVRLTDRIEALEKRAQCSAKYCEVNLREAINVE